MVTRVYGRVEGESVIFTLSDNNVWNCNVPAVPDGEYVVELYAEDEAGNVTYFATILFTVDTKHLTFKVKWIKFASDVVNKSAFVANWRVRDFTMSTIRCEVCGGDLYKTC